MHQSTICHTCIFVMLQMVLAKHCFQNCTTDRVSLELIKITSPQLILEYLIKIERNRLQINTLMEIIMHASQKCTIA